MKLTQKEIPRIIHQTWKNDKVPDKWQISHQRYKRIPNFKYILWTDEMNRNLIKDKFPEFLELYDSYEYPIQRADMVRYFILYEYGGVYSDLDISPKDNFLEFFEKYKYEEVAIPECNINNKFLNQDLTNAFMMSQKNSGFWKVVWGYLRKPYQRNFWKRPLAGMRYFNIIFRTGPGVVSDAAKDYDIKVIDYHEVQDGVKTEYFNILEGSSWHSKSEDNVKELGDFFKSYKYLIFLSLIIFFFVVYKMRLR